MSSSSFEPLLLLSHFVHAAQRYFYKLPGSAVVVRYIKSSHRDDPGRTVLELILFLFVIRTLMQRRTRAQDKSGKHFIQFTEKEIDELVDEWVPEPLAPPITPAQQAELDSIPVIMGQNGPRPKLASGKVVTNLASINFTGLSGNDHIKEKAIEALRRFGLGSCGPPGFYGTFDVHMQLEQNIATFLGTEATILYSQAFSTISSVIPAFCKRNDIIVADRGVGFAIQKGLQISRSTIRWYDHNDLTSLESVLAGLVKEKKKRPLTRRFIVTEGIFEKDGALSDLPKLVELKEKYKFRLLLDETFSFGAVGRTGRGLTELYNVPATKVDIITGSLAHGLAAAGGFCAGSKFVVDHQRINAPSYVFSAALPPLLAVSASEGINILQDTPSILATLQDNIRAAWAILGRVECITIPSHQASPILHIYIRNPASNSLSPDTAIEMSLKPSNPHSIHTSNSANPDWDIETEENLLQEVVDECVNQGVLVTKTKRLRGQEMVEARPSIRLAMTAALTKKETEKAVSVVKVALIKVLSKRR